MIRTLWLLFTFFISHGIGYVKYSEHTIRTRIAYDKRFISSSMEERINNGQLTAGDLERLFTPSSRELENLQSISTTGFIGAVISLETLVDLDSVLGYSYAALAAEFGETAPHPREVRDVVGSPLKDAIRSLGWARLPSNWPANLDERFENIVSKFVSVLPVTPQLGAARLIDSIIADGNSLTINTNLPRSIATAALGKAGLSPLFQGNRHSLSCTTHTTLA